MAGFSNDVVFGTNINLSGAETASMILDGQLIIGNTGGNPQVATLNSPGVSLIIINGSGTIGVDIKPPVSVANGGTGAISFTQGSLIFMGVSVFSEDNSNLFWDDTNNRLGIGTTTPLDELHVVGSIDLVHIADESDDHALEIDCDCTGFTDVKAVDIVYISGAVGAGEEEEAILVNIDETASAGGIIKGYEILATAEGSAVIFGYTTGINISPILHNSGTFGNADDILNIAVDVTAALASGGPGNISVFVLDTETMTIGDAAQFGEMEIILGTVSSGAGIAPLFEFSTGGTGFTAFSPSDGTNGFRNTGAILWKPNDLAGWIANATGFLEIRITRTRNMLNTTPIIDELQISATTEFIWDAAGDVNINSLLLATPLAVGQGGTGVNSLLDNAVLVGSGTSPITALTVGTDGQILLGSTAADPVFATATSTDNLLTLTLGAGSLDIVAQDAVAAAIVLTDNAVVRGDGGGQDVQTSTMLISDAGEMTNPSQPAFLAQLSATDEDVTGDGTNFQVGSGNVFTEIYDQGADFNVDGTFTAPVDGRYLFCTDMDIGALTTAFTLASIRFTASNRTIKMGELDPGNVFASNNRLGLLGSSFMDMDASDTCTVNIVVSGGTLIINIVASSIVSYFSGYLSC